MVVSIYANSVDNTINLMLKNDKLFEIIDSKKYGKTIITIGKSDNAKENIAYDIAKQEALKNLASFLYGETINSNESFVTLEQNGTIDEKYFSSITSNIDASLKSSFLYKSGRYNEEYYTVVLLAEKNTASKDTFKKITNSNVIESRGYSSLSEGISKARQNALNEALRSAVEQYSGVQMASKTSIENAEKYRGKLSSVSKGYIKKYDVIKEFKDGNNFVVVIVAEVAEDEPNAEKSIDAIKENMGRPSFYIISTDNRLKSMIENILSKNQLDIAINKRDAKYIITSNASKFEYEVPALKNMMGIQTTIEIVVKDVFANENIINISNDPENSVEISKSPNIRERNSYNYAMEEIEEKFIKNINSQFINKFNNGNKVRVKLERFDRMRDVDELKECIESLPLVKSVNVSPVKNYNVYYDVIYLGNPSDLQLSIMKKSREFRLRGLRVKTSSDSEIIFKF